MSGNFYGVAYRSIGSKTAASRPLAWGIDLVLIMGLLDGSTKAHRDEGKEPKGSCDLDHDIL